MSGIKVPRSPREPEISEEVNFEGKDFILV